ncbi:hypothetical protein ACSBR1_043601 [Camellia fascicularis]
MGCPLVIWTINIQNGKRTVPGSLWLSTEVLKSGPSFLPLAKVSPIGLIAWKIIHLELGLFSGSVEELICVALSVLFFGFVFASCNGGWENRWVKSDWKKDENLAGEWNFTSGKWNGDAEDKEATPKTIMRTMGVKGLALYHLKSHLQKCRLGKQSCKELPDSSKDASCIAESQDTGSCTASSSKLAQDLNER